MATWKIVQGKNKIEIIAPDGIVRFHGKNIRMVLTHFALTLERCDQLSNDILAIIKELDESTTPLDRWGSAIADKLRAAISTQK